MFIGGKSSGLYEDLEESIYSFNNGGYASFNEVGRMGFTLKPTLVDQNVQFVFEFEFEGGTVLRDTTNVIYLKP